MCAHVYSIYARIFMSSCAHLGFYVYYSVLFRSIIISIYNIIKKHGTQLGTEPERNRKHPFHKIGGSIKFMETETIKRYGMEWKPMGTVPLNEKIVIATRNGYIKTVLCLEQEGAGFYRLKGFYNGKISVMRPVGWQTARKYDE